MEIAKKIVDGVQNDITAIRYDDRCGIYYVVDHCHKQSSIR